jgi:hypothetical protein
LLPALSLSVSACRENTCSFRESGNQPRTLKFSLKMAPESGCRLPIQQSKSFLKRTKTRRKEKEGKRNKSSIYCELSSDTSIQRYGILYFAGKQKPLIIDQVQVQVLQITCVSYLEGACGFSSYPACERGRSAGFLSPRTTTPIRSPHFLIQVMEQAYSERCFVDLQVLRNHFPVDSHTLLVKE